MERLVLDVCTCTDLSYVTGTRVPYIIDIILQTTNAADTQKSETMRNKNSQHLHKKWTWRKPKGKPNRPLSAYNIFFADVRQDLITARKNSNGIGFQNLAQAVAQKWKDLDPLLKVPYVEKAKVAMAQYKVDLLRWESSQKKLHMSVLFPTVEVASFNNDVPSVSPSPITPVKSRNFRVETSNDMILSLRVSLCSPSYNSSRININTYPSPIHNTFIPQNQTNESMYAQTLMNDTSIPSSYLAAVSNQSTLHHSASAASACVTPTLHHRRLCSVNKPQSYIMHDDAFEPLPLSNTIGHCNKRFTLPVEESNILKYQNSEVFPLAIANVHRTPVGENRSVDRINEAIDICYRDPHGQMQNQFKIDANKSSWNDQLEELLRSLENDEGNRFM